MTAAAPPWSEMVKYDLNTGDIVWRIPTGVQEAPPEYNIPNNTGVQFPRNAPLVTAGGLIFLAIGPERKVHAYDRATGKELWQHSLPNGAEGMPATYQVNGRQFVVLPVAQANGTFPAMFNNAGGAQTGPGGAPRRTGPEEPAAVKVGAAADRRCRARTSRSRYRNRDAGRGRQGRLTPERDQRPDFHFLVEDEQTDRRSLDAIKSHRLGCRWRIEDLHVGVQIGGFAAHSNAIAFGGAELHM